jgi:hypothetical protein
VVGAVGKLGIRPRLPDFQAECKSPAVGLLHETCFSTAHLPTDTAIDPKKDEELLSDHQDRQFLRYFRTGRTPSCRLTTLPQVARELQLNVGT